MTPTKPSECVAAVSLSEEGADHPYLSIFYTKEDGMLTFFALPVHGKTEANADGESFLTYNDQGEIEPDGICPLVFGTVHDDGSGSLMEGDDSGIYLRSESDALNLVAAIRAVYQMVGELTE